MVQVYAANFQENRLRFVCGNDKLAFAAVMRYAILVQSEFSKVACFLLPKFGAISSAIQDFGDCSCDAVVHSAQRLQRPRLRKNPPRYALMSKEKRGSFFTYSWSFFAYS